MDFWPWLVLLSNSSIASCSSDLGGVGRPVLHISKADWTFSFGCCTSFQIHSSLTLMHYFHISSSHTELYILAFLLEQMINSIQ